MHYSSGSSSSILLQYSTKHVEIIVLEGQGRKKKVTKDSSILFYVIRILILLFDAQIKYVNYNNLTTLQTRNKISIHTRNYSVH